MFDTRHAIVVLACHAVFGCQPSTPPPEPPPAEQLDVEFADLVVRFSTCLTKRRASHPELRSFVVPAREDVPPDASSWTLLLDGMVRHPKGKRRGGSTAEVRAEVVLALDAGDGAWVPRCRYSMTAWGRVRCFDFIATVDSAPLEGLLDRCWKKTGETIR